MWANRKDKIILTKENDLDGLRVLPCLSKTNPYSY